MAERDCCQKNKLLYYLIKYWKQTLVLFMVYYYEPFLLVLSQSSQDTAAVSKYLLTLIQWQLVLGFLQTHSDLWLAIILVFVHQFVFLWYTLSLFYFRQHCGCFSALVSKVNIPLIIPSHVWIDYPPSSTHPLISAWPKLDCSSAHNVWVWFYCGYYQSKPQQCGPQTSLGLARPRIRPL